MTNILGKMRIFFYILYIDFSLNQVRVRDIVAEDENTFEIHKLECEKDRYRTADKTRGGILMQIECESEDKKNEWVKAINSEVKHLRSTARNISDRFWTF